MGHQNITFGGIRGNCIISCKSNVTVRIPHTQSESKLPWVFFLLRTEPSRLLFQTSPSFYDHASWHFKRSFHACARSDEERRACLHWRIKHSCSCEMNPLLSCGCLISGVSHRRRRNRVNANEMWWKASPRVAQAEHTSSDYCTINHPCVNASAFVIRAPIRRRTCAARVINLGLESEHRGVTCGSDIYTVTHREASR